ITTRALAEEACRIEIDTLGEPIGKQDQYMAAFGGITCLTFAKNGEVTVTPLNISPDIIEELERHIMLFYTGIRRNSADVLSGQNNASQRDDKKVIENLHKIEEIGEEAKIALESGNVHRFGQLLDIHWQTKKNLSNKVSRPEIDRWYALARQNGALGGKIMGAGGGGFFMFYVEGNKNKLRQAMRRESLREMRFKFDLEGSKVLVNF
ncbi:galactokinase, partial [Candidatus Aerophobetes bacterium]|nr:galactokinase [Candidatus Aerophobetes bacterium]